MKILQQFVPPTPTDIMTLRNRRNGNHFRRNVLCIILLMLLVGVATPSPAQVANGWHEHVGEIVLERATEQLTHPAVGDSVPLRVSGVWWDRNNYNLWRAEAASWFNSTPCRVHGFVDESNIQNIPRFKFAGPAWNSDLQADSARLLVRRAFTEWSNVEDAGNFSIETGLAFREVPSDSVAEIEVRWSPLSGAANLNRAIYRDGLVGSSTLTFNSANDWAFGTAAATPQGEMHFYSTALHEVGHIVGLWESRDTTSVMIFRRTPGPNGPSFDQIDQQSRRLAVALYSTPVQVPAERCLEVGLAPSPLQIQRMRMH
jgi:hypothetical protein